MLIFIIGVNIRGNNGEELKPNIEKLYSTKQFDQTGVIPNQKSTVPLLGQLTPNHKVTEINAPINVACVFAASTQGINDLGFNSMVYTGLQKAQTDGLCTFVYAEPTDSSQYPGMLQTYAASGTYDLIVTIGYDQISAVNTTAINYPSQSIVLIDQVVIQGNVRSVIFEEQEGSFLVGAIAGLMTQTGKVGFIGGMDIPLIREFWAGYTAGVFYEKNNSYIEVIEDFVGAWGDPVTGKNIAEAMWAEGVDIIFVAAGASGIGALESVNEQGGGFYAIGVDADQDSLYPGRILCSMMKRVDLAVYNAIKDVYNSNWSADVQTLGMAENGVGLSPLIYTKDKIGFDKIQEVNVTVRNRIISGEISVPTNSTNLAQWMTDMNIVTKTYTPNSPITITSDTQLNSSFPGLGTIDDPIRIEGYNITTSSGALIEISGTTLYCQIGNNFLNGLSSSGYGIYFHNVKHVTIEENIIYHNGLNGIWLESSNYNSIINNTVYWNSWTGIKLGWSSNNNTVVNNAVFGNSEYGIWLGEGGSSNDNSIVSNIIVNNNWGGINLEESSQNLLFKNLVYNNTGGITLSSSNLNIIEHNTIYKNNEGISLTASHNTTISHNLVYSNEWVGIQLSSFSQNNTIAKNTVYDTNGDGIRLYSSSKNMICHNTAYNNDLNGIRLEDDIIYNKIDNNTVFGNNENGIWVYNNEGMVSSYISRNIITSNRAYENTYEGIFILWSYENEISNNTACDNNFAGIVISESDNCIISYNIINYTVAGNNDRRGISLWESRSNNISHNTVYNSEFAIQINPYHSEENNLATYNTVFNNINGFMIGGKNNKIHRNLLYDNNDGILCFGNNNKITANFIYNHKDSGIKLSSAHYNDISDNDVHDNEINGINLEDSDYNIISNNTITNNPNEGIYLKNSDYNTITMNHFVSGPQVNDDGANNVFILNYWSGWTSPDADGDGIVDNPYSIGSENQDPYPLVSRINVHVLTPPEVSNLKGGEILSGTITIEWAASVDSLGHPLTYTVYYSYDGGNTWNQLTSGLTTTNYDWDTTTVDDDTTYRIKVVTSCLVGITNEAVSNLFTIQNEEPTTTMTTTSSSTTTSVAPSIPVLGMTGLMAVLSMISIIVLKKNGRLHDL